MNRGFAKQLIVGKKLEKAQKLCSIQKHASL